MKKALILTYYWPPGSGPGVQRWLKFCKYMPDHDWTPIVITVKNGSYPSVDNSLSEEVPDDTRVIRTRTIEPFAFYNALRGKRGKSIEVGMGNIKDKQSLFARISNHIRANYFVPDARIGWNIATLPEALRVIKTEKPDVIITTGPPHSTHLMGEKLHDSSGIPWIVDLRDPWTSIYYNAFLDRTARTTDRDAKLENDVASTADAIIVASPGLKEEFESRSKAIKLIPNGYDEEDFLHLNPSPASEFTLSYVGNLKAVQNVDALLLAISELTSENESFKNVFRLEITGNIAESIKKKIDESGIASSVIIKPFVPHKDAIERMLSAHALLLPIPDEEGNKSILTGKIFEYLATRRPILSIGPLDGNAASILHECEKEPMLDYHDKDGMKGFLNKLFEEHAMHASPLVTGNNGYKKYSRKGNTEALIELLNQITV